MTDKFFDIDGGILLWLQEHLRNGFLTPVIKGITYLGDHGIIMITACLLLLIIPKTRKLGIMCSISLAMTFLMNNLILKNLVARTRPYEVVEGLSCLVGKQHDYSFPSGHSGAAFAVASVIYSQTPKKVGIPVVILALLIALSRLYVGVHYPSDVLAGIITGCLYGFIAVKLYKAAAKKLTPKDESFEEDTDEESEDYK